MNLILGHFWHNSVDKPRNQSPWPHYFMLCEKKNLLQRLKVEKEKTIWLLMLNKATIYSLCEKKHQNFGINNNQHLSKFLGLQRSTMVKNDKKSLISDFCQFLAGKFKFFVTLFFFSNFVNFWYRNSWKMRLLRIFSTKMFSLLFCCQPPSKILSPKRSSWVNALWPTTCGFTSSIMRPHL